MTGSWKPVVQIRDEDGWHSNALRFATRDEALIWARDLHGRWLATVGYDAHPSDDPVTHRIVDGVFSHITPDVTIDHRREAHD